MRNTETMPCPFCGQAPTVELAYRWMVSCEAAVCPANPDVGHPFRHEAVALWNRRAAPQPEEAPDA